MALLADEYTRELRPKPVRPRASRTATRGVAPRSAMPPWVQEELAWQEAANRRAEVAAADAVMAAPRPPVAPKVVRQPAAAPERLFDILKRQDEELAVPRVVATPRPASRVAEPPKHLFDILKRQDEELAVPRVVATPRPVPRVAEPPKRLFDVLKRQDEELAAPRVVAVPTPTEAGALVDAAFRRGTPEYDARIREMVNAPLNGIASGVGTFSTVGEPKTKLPWQKPSDLNAPRDEVMEAARVVVTEPTRELDPRGPAQERGPSAPTMGDLSVDVRRLLRADTDELLMDASGPGARTFALTPAEESMYASLSTEEFVPEWLIDYYKRDARIPNSDALNEQIEALSDQVNTVAGTIAELELLGKQDAADRVRAGGELEESVGLSDVGRGLRYGTLETLESLGRPGGAAFRGFTDGVDAALAGDFAGIPGAVGSGLVGGFLDPSSGAGDTLPFVRDIGPQWLQNPISFGLETFLDPLGAAGKLGKIDDGFRSLGRVPDVVRSLDGFVRRGDDLIRKGDDVIRKADDVWNGTRGRFGRGGGDDVVDVPPSGSSGFERRLQQVPSTVDSHADLFPDVPRAGSSISEFVVPSSSGLYVPSDLVESAGPIFRGTPREALQHLSRQANELEELVDDVYRLDPGLGRELTAGGGYQAMDTNDLLSRASIFEEQVAGLTVDWAGAYDDLRLPNGAFSNRADSVEAMVGAVLPRFRAAVGMTNVGSLSERIFGELEAAALSAQFVDLVLRVSRAERTRWALKELGSSLLEKGAIELLDEN
jgi:hypothetical protein